MKCCDFELRLQDLLDEREQKSLCAADLPAPLRLHVERCDECAEVLGGYRALLRVLSSARPSESAFRAEDIVELTKPAPRQFRWLRTVVPLATAATLMIAALLVQWIAAPVAVEQAGLTPSDTALQLVATTKFDAVLPSNADPRFAPFATPMEINERSLGLMLNLAGLGPVTFPAELLEVQLIEKPSWMVQVTDGLKPVTERMTGTLNALFRVLPATAAEKDNGQGASYDRYDPNQRLV